MLESALPAWRQGTKIPNTEEELRELWGMLSKQKLDVSCCQGVFHIPQADLPDRGFVRMLLGVSANVGKAKMSLTGAVFDIHGHGPYGDLRWRLKPGPNTGETKEKETLEVTIFAYPRKIKQIACQPEEVAAMLSKGIQELVIESGE
ncbi:MAG: hypothetical protein ABR915_12010 [Thermoguttaceae bacterium]|jgi:hypothetical protein